MSEISRGNELNELRNATNEQGTKPIRVLDRAKKN
jgi:hypothetical protein